MRSGWESLRGAWRRLTERLRRRTQAEGARPVEPEIHPGKLILLPRNDLNYKAARHARPAPGVLNVHGHGNPQRVGGLDSGQLADLIRRSGQWTPGMPVKLDACWAGKGEDNIAHRLAALLQTEVTAATTRTLYFGRWSLGPWHAYDIPFTRRAGLLWPGRWVAYGPGGDPLPRTKKR